MRTEPGEGPGTAMTSTRKRLAFVAVILLAIGATTVTPLTENRAEFESTDIVVGTTVGDADAHTYELPISTWPTTVCIEVENTHASVALTDLAIQSKAHSSATWRTVLNGTKWADETITMLDWCSNGSCATLAATGKVEIWLTVPAPTRLRVGAASATTGKFAVRGTMAARK